DSSDLVDADDHGEKVLASTAILLFVSDSGQTHSRDPSKEVSRYLVIPVNLKGDWTNLFLSKISDGMSETLLIRSQLHLIISRTRYHSARQTYTNTRTSTLIIPLNFGTHRPMYDSRLEAELSAPL